MRDLRKCFERFSFWLLCNLFETSQKPSREKIWRWRTTLDIAFRIAAHLLAWRLSMITHHEPSRIRANQGESAVSNYHESWITTDHYRTFRIITHRRAISITVMTIMGMCGQPSPGTSWSVSGQILTLVALVNIQILGQWMSMDVHPPYVWDTWSNDTNFQTFPTLGFLAISILLRKKNWKRMKSLVSRHQRWLSIFVLTADRSCREYPQAHSNTRYQKKMCFVYFFGSLYVNSVLDCYGY